MKKTKTLFGDEARQALKKGIEAVAKPVAATAGPKGRNAVYRDPVMPTVTNDGVSIARRINPEDPFESIGADLVKQAAEKTNQEAGDGTTASIVLASAIIEKGMEELSGGKSPMTIKKELEEEKDRVVGILKKGSRKALDILAVAKISVEDDKLAMFVADAVLKAGQRGVVMVEEGSGNDIEIDEAKGYFWERGYVSPYFINNERGECVLENVAIIVTDRYMNRNSEIIPVLNQLKQEGITNCLVMVDRMEGELLQTLVLNKIKGVFNTVAVKRPPSDAELEDIAFITNGTAVTKDRGIREITRSHVGFAKRVVVGADRALIVTDDSPGRKQRIEQLEGEAKKLKSSHKEEEAQAIHGRLAKLSDGIIVLRAGARTEAEMKYLTAKLVDAVCACKAAQDEGIVKGGGMALFEAGEEVGGMLGEAIQEPYRVIMKNAGLEPDGLGYDVSTGQSVKDLFKANIVDPLKVVRCSLENAVSLAKTLLTLETVVVEIEKESPPENSQVRQ